MATYSTLVTITPINYATGSTVNYTVPAKSELTINYMQIRGGFGDTGTFTDSNGNSALVVTNGQIMGPLPAQPLGPSQTYTTMTIPAGWVLTITNGTLSAVLKTYS